MNNPKCPRCGDSRSNFVGSPLLKNRQCVPCGWVYIQVEAPAEPFPNPNPMLVDVGRVQLFLRAVTIGRDMRAAQKSYFQTRDGKWLNESKRLEKLFDEAVKQALKDTE